MVDIPAGSFELAQNETDPKTITLSAFKMAETELTFAEYDIFVYANQAKKDAVANAEPAVLPHPECFELPDDAGFGRGDRPVINISWNCANAYIAWLNEQLQLEPEHGFRLPSETEWEYAIRANVHSQTEYYWNNGDPKKFAWFNGNSEDMTQPVREKLPNNFGLYDMSGNVWEWVQDCYQDGYKNTPTDGKPWNPLECASQSRVLRGGSWFDEQDYLRSAFRYWDVPVGRNYSIGFRLAQDLP
jgi:formylglycine-generating enzyme required for sulfatase activity